MYVIYVREIATEDNPNFAGEVNDYFFGKRENDVTWLILHDVRTFANDYFFATKAAACRAKKVHEHEELYWTAEVEVLTVDEAVELAKTF